MRQMLALTINSLDITQLTLAAATDSEAEFVPDVIFRSVNVTTYRRSMLTGTRPASSAVPVKCRSSLNRPVTLKNRASTANKTISGQSLLCLAYKKDSLGAVSCMSISPSVNLSSD